MRPPPLPKAYFIGFPRALHYSNISFYSIKNDVVSIFSKFYLSGCVSALQCIDSTY